MKTPHDPRHRWRLDLFKTLYQYSFQPNQPNLESSLQSILLHLPQIDNLIQKYAPEWPLDKINKIDLAILRLAIFELLTAHAPYKVIIDEAVEIAKHYGSDRSHAFINGVLGQIIANENINLIKSPPNHEPTSTQS